MSRRCMRNEDGYVICYTDGACRGNGQYGAKAGIGVYFGDNHPWNISERLNPSFRQTNNTAEIQAAVEAIYQARDREEYRLEIYSDCYLMIKGITDWIDDWEYNDWVTSAGKPVKNKRDFLKLRNAINSMDQISFVHVPGHAESYGNHRADKLARDGARCNRYFDRQYGVVYIY